MHVVSPTEMHLCFILSELAVQQLAVIFSFLSLKGYTPFSSNIPVIQFKKKKHNIYKYTLKAYSTY